MILRLLKSTEWGQLLDFVSPSFFDVMPAGSLAALSAEDLRLLLCGTEQLCLSTLQAITLDDAHHRFAPRVADSCQVTGGEAAVAHVARVHG